MRGGEELLLGICGREADFSASAASAPPPVEMATIFCRPVFVGLRFGLIWLDGWDGAPCDAVFDAGYVSGILRSVRRRKKRRIARDARERMSPRVWSRVWA